jgi:hypothetical protein
MVKSKIPIYFLLINYLLFGENSFSPFLTINNNIRNGTIIDIDAQTHIDYGLAYPLTYEFDIPDASNNLYAYRKFKSDQEWDRVTEQTSNDFFNGIEAVRFDYNENTAFVSIAFSHISDSIYIKITDSENNHITASFSKISKYYDDREAVVTVTADDWADWNNQNFIETCQNFRNYNLWLSCAVITDISQYVWDDIQEQLDLGYIEAVSHSRTHPYIPYEFLESEVLGSRQDLIENLDLPSLSRYGIREYIYAWIAPYGEYDQDIDTLVSFGKYLISRMFYWGENDFSDWDSTLNKFYPVGASIEVGSSSYWGSTDIIELNNTFDSVYLSNGIYHLMTHPNILEWDQDFTWNHLEHISNRLDIWYVGFGHLYLYHFLSNFVQGANLDITENQLPSTLNVKLHQNHPNPFNPTTRLRYNLYKNTDVKITIYDIMGREVRTLIDNRQSAGNKSVMWDATNDLGQRVSAGMYLYRISAEEFVKVKKMLLIK